VRSRRSSVTRFAVRIALLAGAMLAAGACAAPTHERDAQLGGDPFRIGELRVMIRPPREVDILCRMAQNAPPQVEVLGCYIETSKLIIAIDDPYVILHEMKHYFEGAWHQAP